MGEPYRYRAFISYNHRDRKWGEWLRRALESYRVPKRLVGTEGRDGPIPARLFPVYRDREETPTSADLSEQIQSALAQSAYLIVICSPNAVASRWVNEEILTFKRQGRANRILAVIVDGEPNVDDKPPILGPDGMPLEECFPEALRYHLGTDGTLGPERTEPVAADARPQGDGKENAKLKLIAGLLGVGYDDLKQRDHEAQRRRFRQLALVASAVSLSLAGLLAVAVVFLLASEETRNAALIAQSQFLARDAQDAIAQGDGATGLALALSALPRDLSHPDRPIVMDAEFALEAANLNSWTGAVLDTHRGDLSFAIISPDGKFAATTADDGTLLLVDLVQRRLRATLRSQSAGRSFITSIEFSPDSKYLLTASADQFIRLWSVKTGALANELLLEGYARFAHYSPDGRYVVGASDDGAFNVWDAKSFLPIQTFDAGGEIVLDAAFSPDGKSILATLKGGSVQIRDVASGKKIREFRPPPELNYQPTYSEAIWSHSGARVAMRMYDKIQIFDLQSGSVISIKSDYLFGVKFSPNDEYLLATSSDRAYLWESITGRLAATFDVHPQIISHAIFSPDGKHIAATLGDHTIRVWPVARPDEVHVLRGHDRDVFFAAYSPDNRTIVTSSSDGTVRIWQDPDVPPRREGYRFASMYSPDGTQELLADGNVISLSIQGRGTRILADDKHKGYLKGIFSPDGANALAIGESGLAELWNLKSGILEQTLIGGYGTVFGGAFAPNGEYVVTGGQDGTLRVWRTSDGVQTARLEGLGVISSVAFSPNGRQVLAVAGRRTMLWDVGAKKPKFEFVQAEPLNSFAAFSGDGARVVTARDDGTAVVLDANTGRQLAALWGHQGEIEFAAFSADNSRLVTVSRDRTLRLWDVARAREIATIALPVFVVATAGFSRDGSRIYATIDEWAKSWVLPPRCQRLIDMSLHRLAAGNLGLSPARRAQHFLLDPPSGFATWIYSAVRPFFAWLLPAAGDKCG